MLGQHHRMAGPSKGKGKSGRGGGKTTSLSIKETKPSADGRRIECPIDPELKKKSDKAAAIARGKLSS